MTASVVSPTGATRLAAVIGDPVRHSLSPAIHNAAFTTAGLDWLFVALPVASGGGREAVEAMRLLGISGLSVTMPHKADVAAAVDRRTTAADALGFCNCVFWDGDQLVGDTTDGDGLVRSLADDGIDVGGARIAVVGTGGAASAIVEALGRAGAADIAILSRSRHRADHCGRLAATARPGDDADLGLMDVVINASPIGMTGGPDPGGVPVDVDRLSDRQAVVDIVYEPRTTALLAAARDRGAKTVNGVGMLVHQAALQFERWTGKTAPLDAMRVAGFRRSNDAV